MNEPMLDLKGVEKGYNRGKPSEVIVLRGVDLAVTRGEVVALVAPSGAGKSTLLSAIAGFLPPAGGMVRWQGQDLGPIAPGQRPVPSWPCPR